MVVETLFLDGPPCFRSRGQPLRREKGSQVAEGNGRQGPARPGLPLCRICGALVASSGSSGVRRCAAQGKGGGEDTVGLIFLAILVGRHAVPPCCEQTQSVMKAVGGRGCGSDVTSLPRCTTCRTVKVNVVLASSLVEET